MYKKILTQAHMHAKLTTSHPHFQIFIDMHRNAYRQQ
jgi:hypothetical protein